VLFDNGLQSLFFIFVGFPSFIELLVVFGELRDFMTEFVIGEFVVIGRVLVPFGFSFQDGE
jgi:hypothetical protein